MKQTEQFNRRDGYVSPRTRVVSLRSRRAMLSDSVNIDDLKDEDKYNEW